MSGKPGRPKSPRRNLELWSLLEGGELVVPVSVDTADEAIAGLVRSRSSRSEPPLKFMVRGATAAVSDALVGKCGGLPDDLRVPVLTQLIRRPQRYLKLRSESEEIAMAGVYVAEEAGEGHVVIVRATLARTESQAPYFEVLDVESTALPSALHAEDAAFLAVSLEQLAGRAEDVVHDFAWGGTDRCSRALWCGAPADAEPRTVETELNLMGCVAGVKLSLVRRMPELTSLGQPSDILFEWEAGMTTQESRVANAYRSAGGEVVTLTCDSFAEAVDITRVELHRRAQAAILTKPKRTLIPKPDPPAAAPSHTDTRHVAIRGQERGIAPAEIYAALGDRRTRAPQATLGSRPTPGHPVRIGVQAPKANSPDPKDVLLAITQAGRQLTLVVTKPGKRPMVVISAWDPDAPENVGIWRPDRLAPTASGMYALPPTTWVFPP